MKYSTIITLLLIVTVIGYSDFLEPRDSANAASSVQSSANFTDVNLRDEDAVKAKNGPTITVGDTSIYAGYIQASKDNQNPVLVCFQNGSRKWKYDAYETSDDDGKAYGLYWEGGDTLYAVFSATGT